MSPFAAIDYDSGFAVVLGSYAVHTNVADRLILIRFPLLKNNPFVPLAIQRKPDK